MSTGSLRRIGVDFIQTHFGISQLLGLSNGTDELTDLQVLRAYTAPGGERLKSGAVEAAGEGCSAVNGSGENGTFLEVGYVR